MEVDLCNKSTVCPCRVPRRLRGFISASSRVDTVQYVCGAFFRPDRFYCLLSFPHEIQCRAGSPIARTHDIPCGFVFEAPRPACLGTRLWHFGAPRQTFVGSHRLRIRCSCSSSISNSAELRRIHRTRIYARLTVSVAAL